METCWAALEMMGTRGHDLDVVPLWSGCRHWFGIRSIKYDTGTEGLTCVVYIENDLFARVEGG